MYSDSFNGVYIVQFDGSLGELKEITYEYSATIGLDIFYSNSSATTETATFAAGWAQLSGSITGPFSGLDWNISLSTPDSFIDSVASGNHQESHMTSVSKSGTIDQLNFSLFQGGASVEYPFSYSATFASAPYQVSSPLLSANAGRSISLNVDVKYGYIPNSSPAPVPEPESSALWLAGVGALLGGWRRRAQRGG